MAIFETPAACVLGIVTENEGFAIVLLNTIKPGRVSKSKKMNYFCQIIAFNEFKNKSLKHGFHQDKRLQINQRCGD